MYFAVFVKETVKASFLILYMLPIFYMYQYHGKEIWSIVIHFKGNIINEIANVVKAFE